MGSRLHNWRRRILLLLMAVLPQILSLALLATMLWAIKIKEIIQAPAVFQSVAAGLILELEVTGEDRPKVEIGGSIYTSIVQPTGGQGPEFEARVESIEAVEDEEGAGFWRVKAQVINETMPVGAVPEAALETAREVPINGWTRTRRALNVLLAKEDFALFGVKSQGSNEVAQTGGEE